ncbi:hypothetical protein [Actinomadura gamaensis]|uniref:Uncharacterized protein n=1 Tax=Actinomadura gamaensis TaxID=1763541 RepID=A0ABV9UDG4_9ACTN
MIEAHRTVPPGEPGLTGSGHRFPGREGPRPLLQGRADRLRTFSPSVPAFGNQPM